ncbi:RNA polymerase sigma factor [Jiangella alkaliphila]|uniref:RNA polymerase sigma-70 factor, ECF subfamily n=1 Tax=Jiangella alkaliphila TaxID=419479 RepID=A0A1H2K0J5_9ACTN|nr:sigma-70 family RNA polymerase sigma factor [Jiangella alkaliphila]SDU61981.1 RNA polymerase sigma-70 factor, ECF subfamily [Jiangella alkaliphila]
MSESAQPEGTRLRLVSTQTYTGWEAIYRDNVRRVYALMYTKVGNAPDAEDLTTDVFLAALKTLRTTATVGEVRAYLLATARTVLADHWRRTLGWQVTTLDGDTVAGVFEAPDGPDKTARVEAILAELPEQYQRILRLRFLDACSLREAASELGVTVANAKVLQHRALRRAAVIAERTAP